MGKARTAVCPGCWWAAGARVKIPIPIHIIRSRVEVPAIADYNEHKKQIPFRLRDDESLFLFVE